MTDGDRGAVLVTGATGNVGAPLLERLRAGGTTAIAAVVEPTAATGEVRFDFTDRATYPAALTGVDRVFLLRPPALSDVERDVRPFITAMADAGIRHVVFLSVLGVNRAMPHWRIERDIEASGIGWTMLRPAFFMQNLIGPYGEAIRRHDQITEPAGRGRFAFVDAADVAEVAARVLIDPDAHRGTSPTLTGARAVGYAEVASMLSAELGRPITYAPSTLWAHRRALIAGGADRAYANVQLVINVTARLGMAATVRPDLARLLGRPPTTLRDFIADHRAAWAPRAD